MEENKTVGKRFKNHLKRHKGKYITGGVCLVVGATVGVCYGETIKNNLNNVNVIIGRENSIVNNIDQGITVVRRGHAGNIIRCIETGEVFSSQNEVAKFYDIKPSTVANHIKGKTKSVKGLHFEKIGSFNIDEVS